MAKRVPKEGATSESKVGVVKLRANRKLYSARSRDCKTREHSGTLQRSQVPPVPLGAADKTSCRGGVRSCYLVKEDLTDVRGKVTQGRQRPAEDLEEATLDRMQGSLLRGVCVSSRLLGGGDHRSCSGGGGWPLKSWSDS